MCFVVPYSSPDNDEHEHADDHSGNGQVLSFAGRLVGRLALPLAELLMYLNKKVNTHEFKGIGHFLLLLKIIVSIKLTW